MNFNQLALRKQGNFYGLTANIKEEQWGKFIFFYNKSLKIIWLVLKNSQLSMNGEIRSS